ncbi:MAG: spore coat protein CotJB [Eubacterium sp.]|nr:spore coat protein CotJB [Eubacterium sp.]
MQQKKDKKSLMNHVRETHFAMLDAALYLDTHPNDTKAMDYFNKYQHLYREAQKEYENQIGPLNFSGIDTNDGWTWTEEAWPWEGGCR